MRRAKFPACLSAIAPVGRSLGKVWLAKVGAGRLGTVNGDGRGGLKAVRLAMTVFSLFAVCIAGLSHADISSVGFVHAQILELKGIDLPIPTGVTADQVNSVHYMMTQIDTVNAQNGITTNYADGPDATMNIMSADQVIADVTELIVEPTGFQVTLTGMTASDVFSFSLSAAGNFTVDWGDGSAVQTLTRTNTTETTYSHTYAVAGNYVVTIDGLATAYSTRVAPGGAAADAATAAISFYPFANRTKMTKISGDLGKIFPIVNASATGSPRFYQTFSNCTGLTEIPADLFASVQGAPTSFMFRHTFEVCTGLTEIPSDLFAGIQGPPASNVFRGTFRACTGLTGEIPPDLFSGISGPPAEYMFSGIFSTCPGLTGEIPAGLFAGISGAPQPFMFSRAFYLCDGLTGEIPTGLFGAFTGASAVSMFVETFTGCSGLTGIADGIWDLSGMTNVSAAGMFGQIFSGCTNITSASPNIAPGSSERLYDKFTSATGSHVNLAFRSCTNMADYASIPSAWK